MQVKINYCKLTSKGYEIVGLKKDAPQEIVIPDNFDNTPVVSVASSVCSNLPIKSITVPLSVSSIGDKAFNNINSTVIIMKDRKNADGMKLGKDWSGDATVIFDKSVAVDELNEKPPEYKVKVVADKPQKEKDDENGVFVPPIQPDAPDFEPPENKEDNNNNNTVKNKTPKGGYEISEENNKPIISLSSITIDTPPDKTKYIEGNLFDNKGMIITAHYSDKTSKKITDYVVTKLPLLAGTKSVFVSYTDDGITKNTSQEVEVIKKTPTKLEIVTPPNKTRYIEGNVFDTSGMVINIAFDNSLDTNTSNFEAPKEKLVLGQTSVTVSYFENGKEVTAVQPITVVAKTPTKLEISNMPDKTKYIEGNMFDKTGMVIKAHHDNEDIIVVKDYSFSTNKLIKGQKFITVSYKENNRKVTVDIPITMVAKTPTKLEIANMPYKTKYIEGNIFDKTGLVIKAHYDNEDIIVVKDYIVSTDKLIKGQKFITISYKENNSIVTIDVPITVVAKTPTRLEISNMPDKTKYIEGNMFDKTGLVIKVHYDNEDIIVIKDYSFSTNKLIKGQKFITVSYKENNSIVTVDVPITVVAKTPTKLEIANMPDKTKYIEGIVFDKTGLVIKAHYDNGNNIVIKDFIVSSDKLIKGQKYITVSYKENNSIVTVDVPITVVPKTPTKLEIISPPNKTRYIEGNVFNMFGMVIKAYYDNGDVENVNSFTVPTDKLIKGQKYITISYKENNSIVTIDVPITVVPKTPIKLEIKKQPTKTSYTGGLIFRPEGMIVTATYNNQDVIDVSDYTYPAERLKEGQKFVKISYKENNHTVTANVAITVGPQLAVYQKYNCTLTTCSRCNGRGRVSSSKTCPSCGGSGRYSYTEKCSSCGGSGRKPYWKTCSTCGGSGTVNGKTCPSCNGQGSWWWAETCHTCGGSGTIHRSGSCSRCGGDGRITTTTTCPTCRGTGNHGYKKTTYLSDVTCEYKSLPSNGRHSDGSYYVLKHLIEDEIPKKKEDD